MGIQKIKKSVKNFTYFSAPRETFEFDAEDE